MPNLNVRIYNKFDTYENWMKSTLTLGAGEIAIASIPSGDDTGLTPPAIGVKVGDGSKTFAQLGWIQAIAGDVQSWAKAATKPTYKASEIEELKEFVEGVSDIDTNTEYSFTLTENYKIKIQKKDIGGSYADYQSIDLTSAFNAKADKVTGATAGNFAGLDANGNLVDSGKKAADFAEAGHNHDSAYAAKATTEQHIADSNIHVTTADKTKWNGAATQADANKAAIELLNKTDGTVGSVKKTVDDAISALDLANTYDAIGAAAAVLGDANDVAADNTVFGAKKHATDLNTAMDTRVDSVEAKLAGLSSDTVVGEIDSAFQAYDEGVQAGFEGVSGRIDLLDARFESEGTVESKIHTAVQGEAKTRAQADGALNDRIEAIEGDYLTSADEKALQDQITANANAISLLTNGASADEVDGVNDLIQYVKDHGTEVTGMKADIKANSDAIDAIERDYLKAADKKDLQDQFDAIKDGETLDSFKDVEDAISDLNIGNYATKTEAQGYANAKDEAIAAAKKSGDDAQADVNALEIRVGTAESDIDKLQSDVAGIITTGGQPNVLEGIAGVAGTLTDKTFTVTGVSTDLLTQGTQTIIFDCGDSK